MARVTSPHASPAASTRINGIRDWRERLLDKLEAAARLHPPAISVDLASLADHVFTGFEGGFILVPQGTSRSICPPSSPTRSTTSSCASGSLPRDPDTAGGCAAVA